MVVEVLVVVVFLRLWRCCGGLGGIVLVVVLLL